jgi:hypothetical protein
VRRRTALLCASVVAAGLVAASVPAQGATAPSGPQFRQYVAPGDFGEFGGEPSIGVNPRTGAVMLQANLETFRVTGIDRHGAGSATWTAVTPLLPGTFTMDPILVTDRRTGRTIVSQLVDACSLMAYSDNDGATWTDSLLGCGIGATYDHQTVASGPPAAAGPRPSGGYPHNVYYCAHDVLAVECAVSTNGGSTFGTATPVFTNASDCVATSGHLSVAPDGTVYVPPQLCSEGVGLGVSQDGGRSWALRHINSPMLADRRAGDPSVAVADDNTVYATWAGPAVGDPNGSVPRVAVSRDRGRSWLNISTLGGPQKIRNVTFPTVIAGDGDRAAVAFYGSTTGGNDQVDSWSGTWRLYVAQTFDRGRTWATTLASPKPVQVGMICLAGTVGCPGSTRNLLDFNDIALDSRGRVYVAVTVGCVKVSGCTKNDRLQKLTFVRQVSGKTLYRRYDAR